MQKKMLAVAAGLALGTFAYAASAATVSETLPQNTNLLSDNSAEVVINRVGEDPNVIDVGDSLRGIVGFNTYEAGGTSHAIGNGTTVDELTGLFQVIVLTKTDNGDGTFDFTFGVDPAFAAIYGAGAVAVLYDDAAQDFARQDCGATNTVAECEATATGGTQWAIVGDGGLGTFFWSANNAQDDTLLGATLPLTTPLGNFSNGLNLLVNNTGLNFGLVQCVDLTDLSVSLVQFCGQGGVIASGRIASGTNTPYNIFDNVDYTIALQVPEPQTLALLAMGLLGAGFTARRRYR